MSGELCRLCSKESERPIGVFSAEGIEKSMVEVIRMHLADEVNENDYLPKVVCRNCWNRLDDFHKFYNTVVAVKNEFLLKFVKNEEPRFVEINCDSFGCGVGIHPVKLEQELDTFEAHLLERNAFEGDRANEVENPKPEMDVAPDLDDEATSDAIERFDGEISNNDRNDGDSCVSSECSPKAPNLDKEAAHKHNALQKVKPHECEICKKRFTSMLRLGVHVKHIHERSNEQVCTICSKVCTTKGHLIQHLKVHTAANEMRIDCKYCGRSYKDKYLAQRHQKRVHQLDGKIHECPQCQKQFARKDLMNEHIAYRHNPKLHRCNICGKEMRRPADLKKHMITHTPVELHKCGHCAEMFETRSILSKHCRRMHPNERNADGNDTDEDGSESELHDKAVDANNEANWRGKFDHLIPNHIDMLCEICKHPFETLSEASNHYIRQHKQRTIHVKCCQTRIKIAGELRDHIQYHLNPDKFGCSECDETFISKRQLNLHLSIHFPTQLECDICHKTVSTRNGIITHMINKHMPPQEEHICEICEKRFTSKGTLNFHVKHIHERRNEQVCHICAKICSTNGHLVRHLKTHKEFKEPEVNCKYCGKAYKNKYTVQRHIKQVHEQSGEVHECLHCQKQFTKKHLMHLHIAYYHKSKTHKCDICDKEFRKPDDVRKHMVVHTGIASHKCKYCEQSFKFRSTLRSHDKRVHLAEWSADQQTGNDAK